MPRPGASSTNDQAGASVLRHLEPRGERTLVLVANRAPSRPQVAREGDTNVSCAGGLAAVLGPMADQPGTLWVAGADTPIPDGFESPTLHPVALSPDDVEGYYTGFANTTVWPLYHDAIRPSRFEPAWWEAYADVNRRFAKQVARVAPTGSVVWIHDYHFQLVPALVRRRRPDVSVGFFLHIPFPAPDLFRRLPWRDELLRGLLGSHLIGFQDDRSTANFVDACRSIGASIEFPGNGSSGGLGSGTVVRHDHGATTVGTFPIGIDAAAISTLAQQPEAQAAAEELRASLGRPRHVLLGIDRLDYTKGIDVRLLAFRDLLEAGRIQPGEAVFVQVGTPTRAGVPGYREEQERVQHLVGEINGRFGQPGWTPVCFLHRTFAMEEVVGLYRAADVMVVTPLRDGMNLVAKEYVATRHDGTGALVLSEFAGAADQLRAAVLVNPYDRRDVAAGLSDGMRTADGGWRDRMWTMRRVVSSQSNEWWTRRFLGTLARCSPTRRMTGDAGRLVVPAGVPALRGSASP
jgi:alpha,alpha-trehalose-phosphate synthase [UDP-forming]